MHTAPVAAAAAAKNEGVGGAYQRISVDLIDPNPWNPNVVTPDAMVKLRTGIAEMLRKHGNIPPIILRPHPDAKERFQIIDGAHRWEIVRGGKGMDRLAEEIDAFVVNADDMLARRLTLNLNYLRGEPDKAKEADVLATLSKGAGLTPNELSDLLYLDVGDIMDRLTVYDDGAAVLALLKAEKEANEKTEPEEPQDPDEETWLDLKFRVSGAQAKVIRQEVARIAGALKGRNPEGRALEFICVQSLQTPLPHDLVVGTEPEKKAASPKVSKRKGA